TVPARRAEAEEAEGVRVRDRAPERDRQALADLRDRRDADRREGPAAAGTAVADLREAARHDRMAPQAVLPVVADEGPAPVLAPVEAAAVRLARLRVQGFDRALRAIR